MKDTWIDLTSDIAGWRTITVSLFRFWGSVDVFYDIGKIEYLYKH